MAAGALQRAMIDAIRDLQARTTAMEERLRTVYDRCESAEATIPDCVALGAKGGCLITPWHAVGAAHYPHPVGATIRYSWGERRVVESETVAGTDIQVYRLDQQAPEAVQPARYLPWDWPRHLPTDRTGQYLRRRLRALTVKAGGSLHETTVSSLGEDFGADPAVIQTGDSGQPVWLPLPEPVLVGCWQYRGSGPAVHHWWREISRVTAEEGVAPAEATWNL